MILYQKHEHLHIKAYSNSNYASGKGDRKCTFDYCTYIGGNIVTWKSKKQNMMSRSSAEAEYRSIAQTAYEMKWLKFQLTKLDFTMQLPMLIHCDNQIAIFIVNNHAIHERTKHIEVDCYYMRYNDDRDYLYSLYSIFISTCRHFY